MSSASHWFSFCSQPVSKAIGYHTTLVHWTQGQWIRWNRLESKLDFWRSILEVRACFSVGWVPFGSVRSQVEHTVATGTGSLLRTWEVSGFQLDLTGIFYHILSIFKIQVGCWLELLDCSTRTVETMIVRARRLKRSSVNKKELLPTGATYHCNFSDKYQSKYACAVAR